MKTIYTEAKQHLSNCMQPDDTLNESDSRVIDDKTSYDIDCTEDNQTTSGTHYQCNHLLHSDDTSSAFPFKYDKLRGKLSSPADFYFACTCHAFGTTIFSELSVYALLFSGGYFIPAYLISILLYAIPIFAIQTFLGQFSTSGTISALRVVPIFKGLGYSILLLNLTSLTYYGVIAAVPLIYAANSFHTVIPWMNCDNAWNTPNCSTHESYDEEDEYPKMHATVEFFRFIIRTAHDKSSDFSVSWPILCSVFGVWLLTLGILLKKISFIGKFFRCTCIIMISCFIAIMAFLFIHEEISWDIFLSFFEPTINSKTAIFSGMRSAIFMSTWVLGPGYGSVLTMSSYNSFRRNSEKLTYWVSGTHALLAVCAMICGRIAFDNFEYHVGMFHLHVEEEHFMQFLYLCFAYLFGGFTTLPNLWCFLFFGMLFIAELSAVIMQMLTILTAIFDEFENLRTKKTRITIGLSMLMLLFSMYFCTKKGFEHLHILPTVALLTHVFISMILLLIAVWFYGRERFQCDLQFMLGKTLSNLKIFLLRFITPAFLIISILQIIFFLDNEKIPLELSIIVQIVIFIIALIYMIYKLCYTTGSWRSRFNQCFTPHDWHPVDSDNRRFYDEIMGNSEMLVISDNEQQFSEP